VTGPARDRDGDRQAATTLTIERALRKGQVDVTEVNDFNALVFSDATRGGREARGIVRGLRSAGSDV
jgi:hypothetical protein